MEKHINYPVLPTAFKIKLRYLICQKWRGRISITQTGDSFFNVEFLTAGMNHVFTTQLLYSPNMQPSLLAAQAMQNVRTFIEDKYFKREK